MCMFIYLFVVYFSFAPVISAITHLYCELFYIQVLTMVIITETLTSTSHHDIFTYLDYIFSWYLHIYIYISLFKTLSYFSLWHHICFGLAWSTHIYISLFIFISSFDFWVYFSLDRFIYLSIYPYVHIYLSILGFIWGYWCKWANKPGNKLWRKKSSFSREFVIIEEDLPEELK